MTALRARRVLVALIMPSVWPGALLAHGLVVFAAVEGAEVLVEAKFSNGQPIQAGEVRVLDADGRELHRLIVAPDTPIRFPLAGGERGLRIEVDAGNGHENYWIVTPNDIAVAEPNG